MAFKLEFLMGSQSRNALLETDIRKELYKILDKIFLKKAA